MQVGSAADRAPGRLRGAARRTMLQTDVVLVCHPSRCERLSTHRMGARHRQSLCHPTVGGLGARNPSLLAARWESLHPNPPRGVSRGGLGWLELSRNDAPLGSCTSSTRATDRRRPATAEKRRRLQAVVHRHISFERASTPLPRDVPHRGVLAPCASILESAPCSGNDELDVEGDERFKRVPGSRHSALFQNGANWRRRSWVSAPAVV